MATLQYGIDVVLSYNKIRFTLGHWIECGQGSRRAARTQRVAMLLTSRTPARRARCIPSGRASPGHREVRLVVEWSRVLAARTWDIVSNQIPDSNDHTRRYTRIFSYQVAKRSPLRARRLNVNIGHEYAALVRVHDCFYHRFVWNRICSLHNY